MSRTFSGVGRPWRIEWESQAPWVSTLARVPKGQWDTPNDPTPTFHRVLRVGRGILDISQR